MTIPESWRKWYGYGKPVYAPGAGVVLASANDIPENWFENAQATMIGHPKLPAGKDPKDIGNFVLINHENGEYSLLVHMKPGSVLVRSGDRVKQGQKVGAIGFAGDSNLSTSALFVDERTYAVQGLGIADLFYALPPNTGRDFDPTTERLGQFGG